MRKNISVKNKRVLEIFDNSPNFSHLVELAVLHYVDGAEYMTRADCISLINAYINTQATEGAEPTQTISTVQKSDLDEILNV